MSDNIDAQTDEGWDGAYSFHISMHGGILMNRPLGLRPFMLFELGTDENDEPLVKVDIGGKFINPDFGTSQNNGKPAIDSDVSLFIADMLGEFVKTVEAGAFDRAVQPADGDTKVKVYDLGTLDEKTGTFSND